jgi:DNA (cytosine-5)-methyltransferase 1
MTLVLSLFPGIGLLDMAFEEQGFCVVRGPDALWGGDIKRFTPPAEKFDGIIGGPPCQCFSRLRYLVEHNGYQIKSENMIPDFERCLIAAKPAWFLMENVKDAPSPNIEGYSVDSFLLNNRYCGGEQSRLRMISFGVKGTCQVNLKKYLELPVFEHIDRAPTVCASGGVKKSLQTKRIGARVMGWKTANALKESLRLQGLPENFLDHAPFTLKGKHQVIGNGVPLPMGQTLAKAVKAYLYQRGT